MNTDTHTLASTDTNVITQIPTLRHTLAQTQGYCFFICIRSVSHLIVMVLVVIKLMLMLMLTLTMLMLMLTLTMLMLTLVLENLKNEIAEIRRFRSSQHCTSTPAV